MRVSNISRWAECESYALTDPVRESQQHVATIVGTLAHSELLLERLIQRGRAA